MDKVPYLMDKHIDLYISGFEAFKGCMEEFLYNKTFLSVGGNTSTAVGLHPNFLSKINGTQSWHSLPSP